MTDSKHPTIDSILDKYEKVMAASIAATDEGHAVIGKLFRVGVHDGRTSAPELIKYIETYVAGQKLPRCLKDEIKTDLKNNSTYEEAAHLATKLTFGRLLNAMDKNNDGVVTLRESEKYFERPPSDESTATHPTNLNRPLIEKRR